MPVQPRNSKTSLSLARVNNLYEVDMNFKQKLIRWFNPVGHAAARKKTLRLLLAGSLALHLFGALIFGGIVMVTSMTKEETVFEAPPPMRTYEPRKVELKVKVQQKQRSSSRPQVVPRMVSSRPSAISLPNIKVDPKLVTTTFQPKFKAVSGTGMGVGVGTGYGTSGFGTGVSQVNFFGIKAGGERIAICVDVSVSMVEEERGGPTSFMRVKQRVNKVIDALKDGTLFNVIVFADGCSVLSRNKMLYSNPESRTSAKRFIAPFNSDGQWGHSGGNFGSYSKGLASAGGTTRLDLAISAAMSQGADTIMVISDGLPAVRKVHSPEQIAAFQKRLAAWRQQNAGAVAKYNTASASAASKKVWVPPRPARPPSKGPPREGHKPFPGSPATKGHWKMVKESTGGRPSPPRMPGAGNWTLSDFVKHVTMIYKAVYVEKGLKEPSIHCIGYKIDKSGRDFLKKLAEHYKGQFRLVNRLK